MLKVRRMLEAGFPIVQVRHGAGRPWDSRNEVQSNSRSLAGQYGQPVTALVRDLMPRVVLDDALVFWAKECRRMPILESTSSATSARKNGRGHNPHGFSKWVAQGSVNRGIPRATDELRFRAEQNDLHVRDLHAMPLRLLRFDYEHFTLRYGRRDIHVDTLDGQVASALVARLAIMNNDQRVDRLTAPCGLNRKTMAFNEVVPSIHPGHGLH